MKPTRPKTPAPKTPARLLRSSKENLLSRAPVRVYCRIRQAHPYKDSDSASSASSTPSEGCITVESSTCVKVTPPLDYGRMAITRAFKYSFREVFPQDSTQLEVFDKVAYPLVENLIKGKSGLLFAYGVTGSGKTYTMTGEPNNPGIMPRCLDVLFNSIENVQARKYIFKPDRCNMFEIQSEADAALQRQSQMYKVVPRSAKKNHSNPDLAVNASECSKIQGVNEDCMYSVFVNYIEIYNNIVYDLLDEGTVGRRSPITKILREDSNHNMYVHGVTEVEVKSREEALEVFYKGIKKKRMAHTVLNSESSRGHSVFTIRLVRAPVDSIGENVVQDKNMMVIRQLSLVDLAGSERTSRTQNTGQRLREAGNINNSLMTLRACLEALRENQQSGTNSRVVPYRDSKMTHLFKNFFDGEGHVRMIVCVNPSNDDFDETLQVMRFAEVAMEVEVPKPKVLGDLNMGMTPGRRKANLIHKQAVARMCLEGKVNQGDQIEIDLAPVYSLGGDLPSLELGSVKAEELIRQLTTYLEMRIQRRSVLLKERAAKVEKFRSDLDDLVKSNLFKNTETATLKVQLEQERARSKAMEQKLMASEEMIASLQRQITSTGMENVDLKQQIEDKEMMLNQQLIEKENQKRKFNRKIVVKEAKMSRELELKLKAQRDKIQEDCAEKNEKIKLATQILTSNDVRDAIRVMPKPIPMPKTKSSENLIESQALTSPNSKRGFPVVNPRHRRSLSADQVEDNWVTHLPKYPVPLGTVMTPTLPRKKSVSKLDIKDLTNKKSANYCLLSQEQDTDGELETKVYKGNILPTSGGGAQVVFQDVEMLTQMGMGSGSGKKRDITDTPTKSKRGSDTKKPRI